MCQRKPRKPLVPQLKRQAAASPRRQQLCCQKHRPAGPRTARGWGVHLQDLVRPLVSHAIWICVVALLHRY